MSEHRQTVGLTGSSGLIGQALKAELLKRGFTVRCFVRHSPRTADEIECHPQEHRVSLNDSDRFDAIVNLAGEPIIGRWTKAKRTRIRSSRVDGTQLLSRRIAEFDQNCTFISASAIGIYGVDAHEWHHEASPLGDGFLADVCKEWEMAAQLARDSGHRVVHPRIGLVLATHGGALGKMLPAFRMGLGGPVGSGDQWNSWITLEDLIGIFVRCIEDDRIAGPVNCVAPTPVQNRDFARILGQQLNRPAFFPVPKFGLRMALGEMAEQTLLASQRVEPRLLSTLGHEFCSPTLSEGFKALFN